jgi:hypothetical protein
MTKHKKKKSSTKHKKTSYAKSNNNSLSSLDIAEMGRDVLWEKTEEDVRDLIDNTHKFFGMGGYNKSRINAILGPSKKYEKSAPGSIPRVQ